MDISAVAHVSRIVGVLWLINCEIRGAGGLLTAATLYPKVRWGVPPEPSESITSTPPSARISN